MIAATFRETSGEGLYTASTFINDGSGDALTLRLDVLFDVSWQVEVGQAPEPAATGIFGFAMLGLIRSRRRQGGGVREVTVAGCGT